MRIAARLGLVALLLVIAPASSAVTIGSAPSITATGPLSVVATQPFSAQIGAVAPCSSASDYRVLVQWGDGRSSRGTLSAPAAGSDSCQIAGGHTYAQVPSTTGLSATMTATPSDGSAPLSTTFPVNVRRWSIDVQAAKSSTHLVENWRLFSFPQGDGTGPYSVTIDWADGSTGTVVPVAGVVEATHEFPRPGTYPVMATLLRNGLAVARVPTRAVISDCGDGAPAAAPRALTLRGAPSARWASAIYYDLTGARIGNASRARWTAQLASGASRAEIVRVIQATPAYHQRIATQLYRNLLGRPPTASELAAAAAQPTPEQALATVALAPEYTALLRNSDTQAFADAFLCDAAHTRVPPPALANAVAAHDNVQVVAAVLGSGAYGNAVARSAVWRLLRAPLSAVHNPLRRALPLASTVEPTEALVASSRNYFAAATGAHTLGDVAVNRAGRIRGRLTGRATLELVVTRARHRVATVGLGTHGRGRLDLRWNRSVGRRRLPPGRYRLIVLAKYAGRVVDTTDALDWTASR